MPAVPIIARFAIDSSDSESTHTAPSSLPSTPLVTTQNLPAAMNADDRLSALENGLAEAKKGQDTIQEILKAIQQRLDQPPTPSVASTPEPSRTTSHRSRPGLPADFDGDRTKGRAFINSCKLYITLCPGEFTDDQSRIHWVLSYMRAGRAASFAERVVSEESETDLNKFATWEAFLEAFAASFCPEDEQSHTLMYLESDKYFQHKRTMDEYIDEFEQLIHKSGYTEALAIVLKFRRGLDQAIQNKIANSADCPGKEDIVGWKKSARTIWFNEYSNNVFNSSSRRATAPASTPGFFARSPAAPSATPARGFFSKSTPVASPPPRSAPAPQAFMGVPMDVDRSRAVKPLPITCRRCGGPGHMARDCPQGFDIRFMTGDELQEFISSHLANMDVEAAAAAASADEEDSGEKDSEGFGSRSG